MPSRDAQARRVRAYAQACRAYLGAWRPYLGAWRAYLVACRPDVGAWRAYLVAWRTYLSSTSRAYAQVGATAAVVILERMGGFVRPAGSGARDRAARLRFAVARRRRMWGVLAIEATLVLLTVAVGLLVSSLL